MLRVGLAALGLGLGWLAWRWYAAHQLLERAEADLARGRWVSALALARRELSIWPGDPRGASVAARCLTRLNRAKEAEPYYRGAGWVGLEDSHRRAMALIAAESFDDAGRVFDEILRHHPDDVLALRRFAGLCYSRRKWARALELSDRLTHIPGAEAIGYTMAGTVHHRLGEYRQAIEAYEQVLRLDPGLRDMPLSPPGVFWEQLAADLIAESRTADARRYLERALASGEDAVLLDLLGRTYQLDGDPAKAEECWRRATEIDPRQADPWLDLGRLELHRKHYPEAIRLLSKAAELSPDSVDPLYNLARAHRLMGNHTEADRLQRRVDALRADPAKK